MWPFRKRSEPPKLLHRVHDLEIRATDVEDALEKLLHQQHRIIAKVNKRHQMALKEAEGDAEDAPQGANGAGAGAQPTPAFNLDPKAALRERAALMRGARR